MSGRSVGAGRKRRRVGALPFPVPRLGGAGAPHRAEDEARAGHAIRSARGANGQAAVELVALLPLYAAVALAILQSLAAGAAAALADHAAQSAAVAIAQGRDGVAAARASLPGWARDRFDARVAGTRVTVRLTPPSLLPGLGRRLRATAVADAGGAR